MCAVTFEFPSQHHDIAGRGGEVAFQSIPTTVRAGSAGGVHVQGPILAAELSRGIYTLLSATEEFTLSATAPAKYW